MGAELATKSGVVQGGCFTSLNDNQDGCIASTRGLYKVLGNFGAGSELGTIARRNADTEAYWTNLSFLSICSMAIRGSSPLLAALPSISRNLFRLKTNTCMRRVRRAASSPCRRARSVRREVVCSLRARLSARCVAAASCSLRLCRRTWVERSCMCLGQGWGQAVCLRTVLGSAYLFPPPPKLYTCE